MSTTTPSASSEEQSASSPSQHDLSVPSQSILSGGDESPAAQSVDMEKHPKGKRKRTAAKDKMILEEAYRSNPKPDKQARQEIVDRVSLNEKEVQIWFQNRRQNDRRRSRPLSPEELAALRFGGMHHVASSDPVTSRIDSDRCFPSSDPESSRPAADHQGSPSPPFATARTRPELKRSHSDAAIVTPRSGGMGRHTDVLPPQSQEVPLSQRSQDAESRGHFFSSSVGYLANRWNLGASFSSPSTLGRGRDDSSRLESLSSPASSNKTRSQSKSRSSVRLSLSLEGKAELISHHASPTRPATPMTPSIDPCGPQPRQRTGLSRSHSALPSITLPPISALTNSLPPRLARGRSRDVQAWESCADSERRDELTAQAENESNGSAIAAISLLRSASGILQSSSTKRNAPLSRPQQQRQSKKARLSRTTSTSARLECVDADSGTKAARGKVNVSMLVSPTDSDKENWSPDEDGNTDPHHRRRPLPAAPAIKMQNPRRLGRLLQDHKGPAMLSNRSQTSPFSLASKSNIDVFDDAKHKSRQNDVEKFMRGDVSPSKKPDLDCIAGLLSLSQGAWR
ncbi:homeobox transcription factor [Metarhizium album ARSEF 1941]|uniref:Homeobox transcription factor n=1 Tax=Metarhizium album (strain ARSEF 1941) TaxID=1081103 RepID=A0A0B2WH53_METAS|nr:homeobox transcription factor [Metarhizium album ARSEF 1941]KHN95321.1 homeobox transcription factor [Metarhizium album ARSEF 1941]